MSWIRGTATGGHIDLSNQIVAAATGRSLQTVDSVAAGGSGYTVGDIITLTGGTFSIAAQLEVLTVSSGAVLTVRIYNAGVYTVDPADPVAQGSVSPAGGTGATFNCTFASNGWTADLDSTYSGSERQVIMHGLGGGTDAIYVGWRTFSSVPGDYYNLELHGFTGYNSALTDFTDQPGMSPGVYNGANASEWSGSYLITSSASFDYFLNVNSYRIIMTAVIGSTAMHGYLGFGNRFATDTEYPYPLLIAGCCAEPAYKATTASPLSTLSDPWAFSTSVSGPMQAYGADGAWHTIVNRKGSNGSFTKVVIPAQQPTGVGSASTLPQDKFMAGGATPFSEVFFATDTGTGGTTVAQILPTGSGNARVLLPNIIVLSDPSPQVLMEIDSVMWLHIYGGLVSGDRVIDGTTVYRVFKNGNRADEYAYLAIKEG